MNIKINNRENLKDYDYKPFRCWSTHLNQCGIVNQLVYIKDKHILCTMGFNHKIIDSVKIIDLNESTKLVNNNTYRDMKTGYLLYYNESTKEFYPMWTFLCTQDNRGFTSYERFKIKIPIENN